MKRKFTLLAAALMLLAFITPPLRAVGQDRSTTTTYTFTNKDWGDSQNAWNNDKSGYSFESSGSARGVQVTTTATGAGATRKTADNSITQIKITVAKSSSGKGSVVVKVGNETVKTITSFNTSPTEQSVSFDTPKSGKVSFVVTCTTNSIYVKSVAITYTPKVETPTFSPVAGNYTSAQNVTISTATEDATIYYTTDGTTPTTSSSVYSSAISVTGSMTINALAVKSGMDNSDVATAEYSIVQGRDLYVTSDHGSVTVTVNNATVELTDDHYVIPQGATVNLSVAPAANYVHSGWIVTSGGVNITNNAFTMPANEVRITAKYASVVVDELTHENVNDAMSGTSGYKEWSGVTDNSDAVYAGQSNYNTNYIQIRSDSPSGIVSTSSGGYIRKIKLTWKGSNTSGRTLTIYGKNSPYNSSLDLHSEDTRGTELGTITYNSGNTSAELEINSDYYYFGIKANGGTAYFEPLEITWQPLLVATPTFSPQGGDFPPGAQNVTLSCATTGASIYYTLDGTDPTDGSTLYQGSISISENSTLKAIAYKDGEHSVIAAANYTFAPVYSTMQAIYDKAMTCSSATPIYIHFDNWVVSGASTNYAFVTDGEKGFVVYDYSQPHGFNVLDVLSGTVQCNVQKYQTNVARVWITKDTEGLNVADDPGTISPLNINVADLSGVNTGALISYDDLTCTSASGSDYIVSDGTTTLKAYTCLYGSYTSSFTVDHRYQIKGIYYQNGTTKLFCPRSATDIAELEFDVTLNQPAAGGAISANKSKAKYGETVTLTATPSENYRFQSWSVMFGENPVTVTNNTFTMPNGNVTVSATFVPVYDVTIASSIQHGAVTADVNEAAAGDVVTLTITPETTPAPGYTLESLTVYKTGEPSTTVTVDGNNQFTMPAYAVTVNATFAKLYNIDIDGSIQNGTVVASLTVAPENTVITLTATPVNTHYELTEWEVLDEDLEEVTVTINPENPNAATVTMPASNISVSATFTQKTYTITYCVNGNSHAIDPAQVLGGSSIGSFPTNPTYGSYNFLGWAQTEGGNDYVTTSYIPTADMTLYAVFGELGEGSLTINPSDVPSSYNTTYDIVTVSGKDFYMKQVMNQNSQIQLKKNEGGIYNNESLGGRIKSIVINYASGATKNITVKPCSEAGTSSLDGIDPTISGNTYTFTFSGDYYYFIMTNGNAATQMTSIVIKYEAEVPLNNVTRISDAQTIASLSENQVIVVENGGVLTFNGTNTNPANLIIEDGAQLIPSTAVSATMQKDVEAYSDATGEGNTDGWYFIALPLNSNEVTPSMLTTGDYDLYHLNPGTTKWENYKTHSGNANPGFKLANGEAYLYANSAGFTINFAGTVKASAESQNVSVSTGWNLVGNPFTYNTYLNRAYYKMNGDRKGIEIVNNNAAIAPCTGVIVKATTEDHVTFTQTDQSVGANHGNVQMVLAQTVTTRGESSSQTLDNAIVSFNEGSLLGKFYFGNQDANLYIPQDNEEYAIVSSSAQGEMPVNFRAYVTGEYTITVNPQEVEMGYLHLIDNIAGVEVDLLANPSYTFNARYDDYESRFRLVFSANMANADLNDDFAFFSNGQLVIANEGEAILQVIDVNGRIIATESINGTCSKAINAKAGVYVLRLINGTDVKTQKMVIR